MKMHIPLRVLLFGLAMAVAVGCGEDKKPKRYKKTQTRKIKRKKVEEKPAAEAADPIDKAWNEPPTAGMCRLRLALFGAGKPIKGRPSFMAPQFELVAVEHLEKIHDEGTRATERKKSKKFNPNEHGRFVWELPPGLWKIYVNPLDELWLPWISEPLELKKDIARSLDVKLKQPKKLRPKYD